MLQIKWNKPPYPSDAVIHEQGITCILGAGIQKYWKTRNG